MLTTLINPRFIPKSIFLPNESLSFWIIELAVSPVYPLLSGALASLGVFVWSFPRGRLFFILDDNPLSVLICSGVGLSICVLLFKTVVVLTGFFPFTDFSLTKTRSVFSPKVLSSFTTPSIISSLLLTIVAIDVGSSFFWVTKALLVGRSLSWVFLTSLNAVVKLFTFVS